MNYLIDTHILLWYMVGDKRVNDEVLSKIETRTNNLFVSNASLWEIVIKSSIGKLTIRGGLQDLKNYLDENGFQLLEYDFEDLQMLLNLPFLHQDPFDRLIVAQAKTKSLTIITNDNQVLKYFEG